MKYYEVYLRSNCYQVEYIEATQDISDIRSLLQTFKTIGIAEIHLYDPVDDWLHKRIQLSAKDFRLHWYDNRLFLSLFLNILNNTIELFFPDTANLFNISRILPG